MTGEEFRELMAAAGLSVRAAAELLGVAPTTIQRWRDWPDWRSPIPHWAVERLGQLAAARRDAQDPRRQLPYLPPPVGPPPVVQPGWGVDTAEQMAEDLGQPRSGA